MLLTQLFSFRSGEVLMRRWLHYSGSGAHCFDTFPAASKHKTYCLWCRSRCCLWSIFSSSSQSPSVTEEWRERERENDKWEDVHHENTSVNEIMCWLQSVRACSGRTARINWLHDGRCYTLDFTRIQFCFLKNSASPATSCLCIHSAFYTSRQQFT